MESPANYLHIYSCIWNYILNKLHIIGDKISHIFDLRKFDQISTTKI